MQPQSPGSWSPTGQDLSAPDLLRDQRFLFLSSLCIPRSFLESSSSFLNCVSAESKDSYNTVLNYQAFYIEFLFFSWNLPFEFTDTMLSQGSACRPFPLFLPTPRRKTESHWRQGYLTVPPGLSLRSSQPVSTSTHGIPPVARPSHEAVPSGRLIAAEGDGFFLL